MFNTQILKWQFWGFLFLLQFLWPRTRHFSRIGGGVEVALWKPHPVIVVKMGIQGWVRGVFHRNLAIFSWALGSFLSGVLMFDDKGSLTKSSSFSCLPQPRGSAFVDIGLYYQVTSPPSDKYSPALALESTPWMCFLISFFRIKCYFLLGRNPVMIRDTYHRWQHSFAFCRMPGHVLHM